MPTNTHGFFPCPFLSEKKPLEQVACSTTIQLIMISCGLTQLSSGAIRARQITDTDNEGQIDMLPRNAQGTFLSWHVMQERNFNLVAPKAAVLLTSSAFALALVLKQ